jgi:membrane protein YqaA with SNARE-associated domain
MDDSLFGKLGRLLIVPPAGRDDGLNLRLWFIGFIVWMVGLTVASQLGFAAYEAGSRPGMAVWLTALYMFYMSLCCTFFPAPTTWIVMLIASNYVATEVGIEHHAVERMLAVGSVGAFCTAMANLNEYHLFTFMLRYGGLARIRRTRFYVVAARWFGIRPFWTIVLFSFIPIPVDVLRWLAITYRYPRLPYFVAYFLGRWVRYAGLAGVTIWGQFKWYHILIIQGALAVLALYKIVEQFIRQHRLGHLEAGGEVRAEGAAVAEEVVTSGQR